MDKPIAPVTAESLWQLVRSARFVWRLSQAAGYTRNTGYESEFLVARELYRGTYYVSDLIEGGTQSIDSEAMIYTEGVDEELFVGQRIPAENCYRFFDLHFHPDRTLWPEPSEPDLGSAQAYMSQGPPNPRVDVRPIGAVAHALDDGDIVALFYQKNVPGDIEQLTRFRDLVGEIYNDDFDASRAADALEQSGLFRAERFLLKRGQRYRPSRRDRAKFSRFAHTPSDGRTQR
jgi:hypothetical protein